MPRITIAQKQEEIDDLTDQLRKKTEEIFDLTVKISELKTEVSSSKKETNELRANLDFVTTQRNRLVGFIEGRESVTSPTITKIDRTQYPEKPVEIDRTERFLEECTLEFIDSSGLTVRNDLLRLRR